MDTPKAVKTTSEFIPEGNIRTWNSLYKTSSFLSLGATVMKHYELQLPLGFPLISSQFISSRKVFVTVVVGHKTGISRLLASLKGLNLFLMPGPATLAIKS